MCFIISKELYTAHHNSLGICHQLKIPHLYRTFNFSTQCIRMADRKLVCLQFSSFSWKGAPSTKENRICGSLNSIAGTPCVGELTVQGMHRIQRLAAQSQCDICLLAFLTALPLTGNNWRGSLRFYSNLCFLIFLHISGLIFLKPTLFPLVK